jgi:hypothetical protein
MRDMSADWEQDKKVMQITEAHILAVLWSDIG